MTELFTIALFKTVSPTPTAFDIYSLFYTSSWAAPTKLAPWRNWMNSSRSTSPDWEEHYSGGAQTVNLFNKYKGRTVAVNMDGDWQIWIYRRDLFEDSQRA